MRGFDEYSNEMFRLYNEKKYSEALQVVVQAAKEFPDNTARTTFWIACLECRMGNTRGALEALEKGLQRGVWWNEDTFRDPDLDPIRNTAELARILKECQRRRQELRNPEKPDLVFHSPLGASRGESFPVIIVLHQRYGEKPTETVRPWSSILQKGVGLAVPWSSQIFAPDGRCWDNLEVAERDVTWVYSQVREQKGVDKSKIVLAGFSQGAALAIYLSLKKAFPCKGFFAVAPSDWVMPEKQRAIERDRPSRAYLEFVQSTDARGVRGQILIGEKDPFLKKMEFLKEEMVRRGLECNYSVEPRIGHEYPQDFGGKLRKAVNFVLEMS